MADLNKLVDELSSLTVIEAAELSKLLEEKWGVTAAAAVAAAVASTPALFSDDDDWCVRHLESLPGSAGHAAADLPAEDVALSTSSNEGRYSAGIVRRANSTQTFGEQFLA